MDLEKMKESKKYTLKEYMFIVMLAVVSVLCLFFDFIIILAALITNSLWTVLYIIPVTLLGIVFWGTFLYLDPTL